MTMLSSRTDRYLAKFSIFLIAVALIAGMLGCGEPTEYDLTISTTAGGSVTATVNGQETVVNQGEEETIPDIPEGTPIHLMATPSSGYRFSQWVGPHVSSIADVTAAATNITMNGRYSIIRYSITADFVEGLEIRNWNHLDAIRNSLHGNHILMNALDSTTDGYEELVHPDGTDGLGWEPITTFVGTFDGRGNEVRDLFIYRPEENGVGLFGYVGEGAVVNNVSVVDANVTGNGRVGSLAGSNRGTVSNSNSAGSVTGSDEHVGGLVGWNQGTVENSYSTSSVNGSNKYVGGLVGWNQGTVSNSNSAGSVTGSDEYVGGLMGWNEEGTVQNQGTVENSYSTSSVNGSNKHVGGLMGWNQGTVQNSHFAGSVTGSDEHVGGLVGWNEGTVDDCYSSANVKGNDKVGGLVGFNNVDGKVSKSHSIGNVISKEGSEIGGLVGWNEGTVSGCNSTGSVSGHLCVGGLVGENVKSVETSYFIGNVDGKDRVGGLVASNCGTVEASNCTGNVSGDYHVGGLAGLNQGTVSDSCFTGNVDGHTYVGGLVGRNDDRVERSYSIGSVNASTRVGGLVGYNFVGSTVNDSYSRANASGTNQHVGGLVGYNEQSSVSDSYSTGRVTADRHAGGLVGENNNGNVSDSFWDTETSGQASSDGGTGKTTAQMMDIATFKDTATEGLDEPWKITDVFPGEAPDRDSIWNIIDDETYPCLSWQSSCWHNSSLDG